MDVRTALVTPLRADAWWRDPAVRWRLGLGLVVFTLATTLVVTLYPFQFHFTLASLSRIDWRPYYPGHNDRDLVQNLLMLAPLGAGLALMRFARASLTRIALEAGTLGLATSVTVETLQIFQRSRFPQVADVWRNTTGCIVGAILAVLVLRLIERERDRRR